LTATDGTITGRGSSDAELNSSATLHYKPLYAAAHNFAGLWLEDRGELGTAATSKEAISPAQLAWIRGKMEG